MQSINYWREIKGTRESQGWEKGDFILDGAFREGLTGAGGGGGAWEISRETESHPGRHWEEVLHPEVAAGHPVPATTGSSGTSERGRWPQELN